LHGCPLDGVETIFALVNEGIKLALRAEAAPAILRDARIATLCEGRALGSKSILVVRSPNQYDWKLALECPAVRRRQVNVGGEVHAVAHWRHYVLVNRGFLGCENERE
jgi:hypothetical protein